METKSLWAKVEDVPMMDTPYTILREQAEILEETTNGKLLGEVETIPKSKSLAEIEMKRIPGYIGDSVSDFKSYHLNIIAPNINYYKFRVLSISFLPTDFYPVYVESDILVELGFDIELKCNTPDEYKNIIGSILSSKRIKTVMERLLMQS